MLSFVSRRTEVPSLLQPFFGAVPIGIARHVIPRSSQYLHTYLPFLHNPDNIYSLFLARYSQPEISNTGAIIKGD